MTWIRPFPAPLNRPIRLGVLISGGGTTLANLHEQIQAGRLQAEIPLVIASRPDCGGIDKARDRGIPCEVVARKSFSSVEQFSEVVFQHCRKAKVDLVLCGGFLSLLKIPADYQYRLLNIHPSLIPAFCGHGFHGLKVHEAVLQRGCKVTGCTVHFVDDIYDHGPILLQRVVPVHPGDSPEILAARVFEAECVAYPEAIQQVASGRVEILGSQSRLSSDPASIPS